MTISENRFEHLANELMHEVFDYLSTNELLESFNKLNKRFSMLISQRLLKVDLSHLSKTEYETLINTLPLHQIDALKVSNKWTINIMSRIPLNALSNLRILTLSYTNYKDLRHLFESKDTFSIFQQLHTLKMQSTNFYGLDQERIFALKKIFSEMPELRCCQIPLMDVNDFDDLMPALTLERLTIDYCTTICLDRLLGYIPNVRSLSVRLYTDLQNFTKYSSTISSRPSISSIRSLEISTVNNIPFHQIEILSKKSLKNLHVFKFYLKTDALSQSCLDYVDDKRWEYLLRSFPSLESFNCCIEIPIQSDIISNSFERNTFFRERDWNFTLHIYTYSYNTILRIHTIPYPKRRLDTIPSKVCINEIGTNQNIYSSVRDLRILIDTIPINVVNNLSDLIYKNVISLTLIANKTFDEQAFLIYLNSIINRDNIRYLTIQLDNCSQWFLANLIETCSKIHALTITTYQSWSKLFQLSPQISMSSIRSLTVYDMLLNFNDQHHMHQLFSQLEMISINITSVEDCYRLLTLLFTSNRVQRMDKLRSLMIKCDFHEPDSIANWIRSNILRKLSYKCTTTTLVIWL